MRKYHRLKTSSTNDPDGSAFKRLLLRFGYGPLSEKNVSQGRSMVMFKGHETDLEPEFREYVPTGTHATYFKGRTVNMTSMQAHKIVGTCSDVDETKGWIRQRKAIK